MSAALPTGAPAARSPVTSVTVRRFEKRDAARWDDFVRCAADATIFHLSVFGDVLEHVLGHRRHYLYAEQGGRIVGVLPLAEIKSHLFGHSLSSLPFFAYGGLLGDGDAALALEAAADDLADALSVDYLEYRNLQARHTDWPRQDLYVTFRKRITPDVEANMAAIPRKQRAMVRKGIKGELRSSVDADVDRFFELYADNMRRHGTPALSKRYFRELKTRLGESCEVLTVTDSAGRSLSSVMSFYFRGDVLPYYAGDHADARNLAANDFKYWELMRRAAERGYTLFDFGRSKVGTGPWSFKKNWGFEPQQLSYEYRLKRLASVPQKNPLNPRYRAFIALWRRLPQVAANVLGPPIARHLG